MAKSNLKEFKASFGVNAEVPDSAAKTITPPGGAVAGETNPIVTSPTSVKLPKTKETTMDSDKAKAKAKVTKEDLDISTDLEAVFNGIDLSDEFKAKAKDIFETAVITLVNAKLAEMTELSEVELQTVTESIHIDMVEKIDSYLDYVVEQWIEENCLVINSGLRTEIAESLIDGIKRVFEENYVSVPEDRVDLVDELATKVEELEDALSNEIHENVSLREEVERWHRDKIVSEIAEGLSDTQTEKLRSLSESVEFETNDQFVEKIENLRESYFTEKKAAAKSEHQMLDEQFEIVEEKPQPIGQMAGYVAAISRSIKK